MHYTLFGIIEDADKYEALACKAEQDEDERLAAVCYVRRAARTAAQRGPGGCWPSSWSSERRVL